MKRELWFVTGWYSTPLFAAIAKALKSEYSIRFIAHDCYSHQYLLSEGLEVFKRSQKSGPVHDQVYCESVSVMDAAFTAQGFGRVERWKDYYIKRSAGFHQWLLSLWAKHDPYAVVIWNGMWHYEKIASAIAAELGIKTVYLENGYFPGTAHVDPKGVNARAEIIQVPSDDLAPGIPCNELEHFIEQTRASFTELKRYTQSGDLTKTLSLKRKLLTGLELLVRDLPFIGGEFLSKLLIMNKAKRKRRLLCSDGPMPERYVFLPLQVSADSQLILNSPWIKSPGDAIKTTYQAIQQVDPSLRLVVKEHPMEDPGISFDEIQREYSSIHWASKDNLQDLIMGAEAVVNINSSVGFQALLFGKPVICLGTALYVRAGLACPSTDDSSLKSALAEISRISPKMDIVKRFAYHLYHLYCSGYRRGQFTKDDVEGISRMIVAKLSV